MRMVSIYTPGRQGGRRGGGGGGGSQGDKVVQCWCVGDRRKGNDAKHLSEADRVHFINNTLPW